MPIIVLIIYALFKKKCLNTTATASHFVLLREKMFSVKVGMRSNSQKLLLVITDGKSNDPKEKFENVIPLANKLGITRFAIGVNLNYKKNIPLF